VDPISTFATTINELKNQQAEAQQIYDSINQEINEISKEQTSIQSEIKDLDTQIVELLAGISIIEDEIVEKQQQIEIVQVEYEVALADEEAQYQAMTTRIKYIYEKGDANYIQLFLEAKSFTEMVDKVDFVEQLYEYDRQMLLDYQQIREEVACLKETLEIEQSELLAIQEELNQEKVILEGLLVEKKAQSEDYEVQLAQAKQEAAAYKTKVKNIQNQVKKLEEEERKKAAQAAAQAAAQNATSTGNSSYSLKVDVNNIKKASGSDLGKSIAIFACQYVGNPYVSGGTSLTNGADCSGFTSAVYKEFGISLSRTSFSQRSDGVAVEYNDAQPGDIICYSGHVGIYIGNGMIVHASSVKTGIKISYATYRPILAVRRII
jgi:peptidoglycan DL-endopeptidase CwlO